MAGHWHAYAWNGGERPSDADRRTPALPNPPLTISEWLHKPKVHVLATYDMADGQAAARQWLITELERYPRGPRDLPPAAQLAHAADLMNRCTDVVWGYWSAQGRYISRALIVCPRDGAPCPYRYAGRQAA
ncbi:hypothetical protein [Streptomyces sp. NPDC002913]